VVSGQFSESVGPGSHLRLSGLLTAFFQAGDATLVMLGDLKEIGGGFAQRPDLAGVLLAFPSFMHVTLGGGGFRPSVPQRLKPCDDLAGFMARLNVVPFPNALLGL